MDENEPGVEAWKAETNACERIRAVITGTQHPLSVREAAETASVEEDTASDCLEELVDDGVLVRRYSDEDDEVLYEPNEFYIKQETVQALVAKNSHEDLVDMQRELEAKIGTWGDEHDVDGPDELRNKAEATPEVAATRELMRVVTDWKLCVYRLSLIRDAINRIEPGE